jgi:hypothetical protein
MVPKMSERQREIASKCVLLSVDFEVGEGEHPPLTITCPPCRIEVLENGKVGHVDLISGSWNEEGSFLRLTANGLKAMWDSLAIFTDVVAADKETADKVMRFAAVSMLQEGQAVLNMDERTIKEARDRLLARFGAKTDATPSSTRPQHQKKYKGHKKSRPPEPKPQSKQEKK